MPKAILSTTPPCLSVRQSLLLLGWALSQDVLSLLGKEYWIPPAEETLLSALLPLTQGLLGGDSFRLTPGEPGPVKNAAQGSGDRLRRQMPGSYPSRAT